MKKLNKFADYPGLREFGLDKNQAEKICKEVFDSKRLNFSFFKNIAGYSSAYSGFFSENFKYALETYLFRNKDDKNKIYAVIITYDIKNKNDYKAYYKEIEFSSEIVPESYMMNNEKFISDYNKYSFYEEYLKNKKKVGKKMKRLIKAKMNRKSSLTQMEQEIFNDAKEFIKDNEEKIYLNTDNGEIDVWYVQLEKYPHEQKIDIIVYQYYEDEDTHDIDTKTNHSFISVEEFLNMTENDFEKLINELAYYAQ